MEVQVEVLPLATSSVQYKSAADRGRTSLLQLLRLHLVALVPFPTWTPLPSALEGQLAPIPDATPCRSSQTSALGDLQTGCTMLGAKQRKSSLRLATQHVHCKVPCNVQSLTARNPHTSTHFQNNAQNHSTHNTSAVVRPEPPPLCDGTSPLHSNTHSNTKVHSFQLVFQSRVRSGRSRRCVINKRKRVLRDSNRNVQMHGTDRRFHHTNRSTIPFLDVRNNV